MLLLHIEKPYLIENHNSHFMLLLKLWMNRVRRGLRLLKRSTSGSKLLAAVGTMFTDTDTESLTIILTT